MPEESGQDEHINPSPSPEHPDGTSGTFNTTAVPSYQERQSGPGAPRPIGNPEDLPIVQKAREESDPIALEEYLKALHKRSEFSSPTALGEFLKTAEPEQAYAQGHVDAAFKIFEAMRDAGEKGRQAAEVGLVDRLSQDEEALAAVFGSDLPSPTLEQILDPKSKLTSVNSYRLRQAGPGAPGPIGNPAGMFDTPQPSANTDSLEPHSSNPTNNQQES